MAKTPSKVAVIGLDCCLPIMLQKYMDEDSLPNIKNLVDKGFFAEDCLCPLPTITPPNWATIATGAWPGTHGITCFHYQLENTSPDNSNIRQAWDSRRWLSEPLWEAADKEGKKSIVMTYPGAWPGNLTHGVIVGGSGFVPGDYRDGLPGLDAHFDLVKDFVVTNGEFLPYSYRGEAVDAEDWANIPNSLGDDLLEIGFDLRTTDGLKPLAPTRWWALISQSDGKKCDTVTVCTQKDYATALFTVKKGQWTPRILTTLTMEDGQKREVFFRAKLMVCSDDASDFRLIIGAMPSTDGSWCNKPEYADIILKGDACIHYSAGLHMLMANQVVDFESYLEMSAEISRWLGQATTNLMEAIPDWEVFYMHSHPCDWFYHMAITDMASQDKAKREKAWEYHKRVYQHEDALVGAIVEAAGKNTLFAIVSDHGAVPDGPTFNPFDALIPAGLAKLKGSAPEGELSESDKATLKLLGHAASDVDYTITKAIPQRETYVYINLKGRYPHGIVEQEDYAKVQQEIIDALLLYRDPNNKNLRPVALALTKEDARLIGLYGDRIGDVVYAINPEWGAQHGAILPTAKYSVGALQSVLILSGPGIAKGVRMEKPCHLTDLVPTLCFLASLPYPNGCEGAVLYPALVDPNFHAKEIAKLKQSLLSMEAAMERGSRQPWDKHDCA